MAFYTAPRVRLGEQSSEEKRVFRTGKRSEQLIDDLMAKGRPWDATIRPEGTRFLRQYVADEACVKDETLAYRGSRWRVAETREACD